MGSRNNSETNYQPAGGQDGTIPISVVMPVYNDVSALPLLLERLFRATDQAGYSTEVIVVDDGSSPATWQYLKALTGDLSDRAILLIRLQANHGQQMATLCGLLHSSHEIMVTIDSDLQQPPEEIPALVDRLRHQGLDLLYGEVASPYSLPRSMVRRLYKGLASILGVIYLHASSFRVLTSSLLTEVADAIESRTFSIDDIFREKAKSAGHMKIGRQGQVVSRPTYTMAKRIVDTVKISYYSRQLEKAGLKFSTFLSVIAVLLFAFNTETPAIAIASILTLSAVALACTAVAVTKKRLYLPLKEQFLIAEKIDRR
jgi:glycosyltransferase involved in cell wall biosynthesis